MKTLVILALVVLALYPWWGPQLGIDIPLLNTFYEWAHASLNGDV